MQLTVLDLALGLLEERPDLALHVLMVILVQLEHLVFRNPAIEARQERLHEALAPLQVEVHDLHPEEEGNEGGLSHPVEVGGACGEADHHHASVGEHEVLPGDEEVFIVRRDLLGADEVVEELSGFDLNARDGRLPLRS